MRQNSRRWTTKRTAEKKHSYPNILRDNKHGNNKEHYNNQHSSQINERVCAINYSCECDDLA